MLNIGEYNNLEVSREVSFGFYLKSGEEEVLLPQNSAPENLQEGDMLDVFVYTDSEDRPIATTNKPKAVVGDFAFLEVVDVNDYGAFMDWGLEKDLFIPFSEQLRRMEFGKKYVVRLYLDELTDRVVGSSKLNNYISDPPTNLKAGYEVEFIVRSFIDPGALCIVDSQYLALFPNTDMSEELNIGDKTKGYIKQIKDDGKVDVYLRKPGFAAVSDSKTVILNMLKEAGGSLPFNSKSDPNDIKETFKMSKKVFKMTIGNLYKERKITITDTGIQIN